MNKPKNESNKQKNIARYRPPGWLELTQQLLKEALRLVDEHHIEPDQVNLWVGEAFADAMLEALRQCNGCPAMVVHNRVHIIVKDKQGNPHPVGMALTFTGDLNYTGGGRLSFIPDDPLPAQIDAIRRAN